jgi:hypothetical protein
MELKILRLAGTFVLAMSIPLKFAAVEAATIPVNCGAGGSGVGTAVQSANPGDTVQVTGTCNESVLVRNEKQRVTIDGGGTATINGGSSTAIIVRGKGILIQGFTISGGSNGISVERGSNAAINNNTIQNATSRGIVVNQFAFAIITNNTIQNNGSDGIGVFDTSHARIGFNQISDPAASPNTIQNNGDRGVNVSKTSSARIYGNTIQNNGSDGVGVFKASHADLASNTINGNGTSFAGGVCVANESGCNGVIAAQNSSIQLGEDNPVDFTDQPNITTVNNANNGIRCSSGANIRGHLGATNQLNGTVSQFGGSATTPNTFAGNCPTAATSLDIP